MTTTIRDSFDELTLNRGMDLTRRITFGNLAHTIHIVFTEDANGVPVLEINGDRRLRVEPTAANSMTVTLAPR